MWFRKTSLLLTVSIFICASAQAQQPLRHFEVFAEGGASFSNQLTDTRLVVGSLQPLTVDVVVDKVSLRTTGRLFTGARFWFDSHQAIEVSYSYAPTDLIFSLACFVNCNSFNGISGGAIRSSFFAANYVHTLPSVARFQPFLTSGLGLVYFSSGINAPLSHRASFAANFGGGFNFDISQRWAVRVEYRDWIFDMPHNPGSFAISGLTHNSAPSIGLAYRF